MRNVILLLILIASLGSSSFAEQQPNILFLFADDWGRYASIYRDIDGSGTINDVTQTPNIDKIARQGVLFTNAYVNAPSCTPCRSSLLSGQYFYRTGQAAILQGAVWDAEIPTYPLMLEESGYHIGYTYKVWGPGTPANAGYGGRRTAYAKAGGQFNGFSQNATKLVEQGNSVEAAKDQLFKQVTGNFKAFLDDREQDQPFCYWFGPTNVHRKWIAGSGKKLWDIDPESLKGKLPAFLPDVPVVREDMADYLGEIAAFDAAVGLLMEQLKASGEADNTLVVISGDHGAPGFPRGKCNLYDFGTQVPLIACWPGKIPADRVVTDFTTLMDLAPTFLEAGSVSPPEVITGQSLLPVMMSEKSGRVNPARKNVITGRERHVAKARPGNLPYPQRAIRTDEFLYVHNFAPDRWPMGDPNEVTENSIPSTDRLTNNTFAAFADLDASPTKAWIIEHRTEPGMQAYYDYAFAKRPQDELYVIAEDPDQINNVASEAKYKDVKESLKQQLMEVLQNSGDPRVAVDPVPFELPPYAGEK